MKKTEIENFIKKMSEIGPKIAETFKFKMGEEITKLDLNAGHLMILKLLNHAKGPLIMSEIADKLSISNPMMTHIIDKLESKHLVSRQRDASDRRIIKISIIRDGKNLVEKLVKHHKEQMISFINSLDEDDQKLYIKSINTLLDIMLRAGKHKK